VVVLTGPRQVGKTSLAKKIGADIEDSVYLDLEYEPDLQKLSNPSLYLERIEEKLVIIDEVQRLPSLFPLLRALVDRNRKPGRFLLLGSASPQLIRDTSESLAGRVAYQELAPFSLQEIKESNKEEQQIRHWIRGGFPESFFAPNAQVSFEWRLNFIRSYLEKDLALLGLDADPLLIRRLWTMLAHNNGQLLNMSKLANSLGISSPTVRRYIDFMESAYLLRRLPPYFFNSKKRIVKSPKIYIRDTGILHSLLNLNHFEDVLGHPVLGNSWEGYIIQEIASLLPPRCELFFYRTQSGVEADVVIAPGGVPEAIVEIKYSGRPKPSRGFYQTMRDLEIDKGFVICPTEEPYPLTEYIQVLGPNHLSNIFS
jgi:predicted AAA+ superfamily ATPase